LKQFPAHLPHGVRPRAEKVERPVIWSLCHDMSSKPRG
jgi:hypothetical protein